MKAEARSRFTASSLSLDSTAAGGVGGVAPGQKKRKESYLKLDVGDKASLDWKKMCCMKELFTL